MYVVQRILEVCIVSIPRCLGCPCSDGIFVTGGPRPALSNIIRSQPSAVEPEKPSLLC